MTMDESPAAVKTKRTYDSTRRRARAQQTRTAVLDTALRRFLADGYFATTIASIAAEAGVSVETIYKAFGSKAGIVLALRSRALEGTGPIPAERRSNALQAREADPRTVIAGWAALATDVSPRVSPILLLVRAAATSDAEMHVLHEEMEADRLRRMSDNARHLHGRGGLRAGITVEEVRDVLFTYSSPELYELLVLRQGWTIDRYRQFLADGMTASLVDAPTPPG